MPTTTHGAFAQAAMHSSSTSVNSPSAESRRPCSPSFFSNACEHLVAAAQHARDVGAHHEHVLSRRVAAVHRVEGRDAVDVRGRQVERGGDRRRAPRRRGSRTRPARGAGRAGRRPARSDSGPRMASIFCWASGEKESGIEVREQLRLWAGGCQVARGCVEEGRRRRADEGAIGGGWEREGGATAGGGTVRLDARERYERARKKRTSRGGTAPAATCTARSGGALGVHRVRRCTRAPRHRAARAARHGSGDHGGGRGAACQPWPLAPPTGRTTPAYSCAIPKKMTRPLYFAAGKPAPDRWKDAHSR